MTETLTTSVMMDEEEMFKAVRLRAVLAVVSLAVMGMIVVVTVVVQLILAGLVDGRMAPVA